MNQIYWIHIIKCLSLQIMSCDFSVKTVTLKDFDSICRTCLGDSKISPLFETLIGEQNVSELLKHCVMIQVTKTDLLPPNICEKCLNDLYKVYEFKNKCHQSETILKQLIQDVPVVDEEKGKITEDFPCKLEEQECEYGCDSYADELESKNHSKEDNTAHICKICLQSYSSLKGLKDHKQQANHWQPHKLQCETCNKQITRSKLKQHMRTHTKERPYQCEICHQRFTASGNLKRHRMTHTGEKPHVCSTCGKGFIQATSLHTHEKIHSESNNKMANYESGALKFVCSFCGRKFKRLAPFNVHLDKHLNVNHPVTSRKKIDLQEPEEHAHICDVCARSYKTKHLLKAHRLTHGEKSYLCADCGKGFVTKAALQSHLKVHTGEKPHTCVICKKSFAHVGSFDSHMLIHAGYKPYNCTYCPKNFTQLSHLRYHLRTHSGEKPYACSYCGKRFSLKGNLTVHVRTHTGETPYVCPVCGKGFYDSSSLKKHKRNHKEDGLEHRGILGSVVRQVAP